MCPPSAMAAGCERLPVPLNSSAVGPNSRLKRHVQQEDAVLKRGTVTAVKNQNRSSKNIELLYD